MHIFLTEISIGALPVFEPTNGRRCGNVSWLYCIDVLASLGNTFTSILSLISQPQYKAMRIAHRQTAKSHVTPDPVQSQYARVQHGSPRHFDLGQDLGEPRLARLTAVGLLRGRGGGRVRFLVWLSEGRNGGVINFDERRATVPYTNFTCTSVV